MLYLLMRKAKCGRSSDCAVQFLAKSLHLTPALAAAFGAPLVVSVEFGTSARYIEELLRELLPDDSELLSSLVAKHVERLIVDGAVGQQENFVKTCAEASKAAVSGACNGPVHDTTGEEPAATIDCIPAATSRQIAVLEV